MLLAEGSVFPYSKCYVGLVWSSAWEWALYKRACEVLHCGLLKARTLGLQETEENTHAAVGSVGDELRTPVLLTHILQHPLYPS
jgi:hypothetical protein